MRYLLLEAKNDPAISMSLANQILKMHLKGNYGDAEWSEALKRAWAMLKQGEFYAMLKGNTFVKNGQSVLRGYSRIKPSKNQKLEDLVPLEAKRESDNPVDPNAVAVYGPVFGKSTRLGYLPREVAFIWSRVVEKGALKLEIAEIMGGKEGKENFGMLIRMKVIRGNEDAFIAPENKVEESAQHFQVGDAVIYNTVRGEVEIIKVGPYAVRFQDREIIWFRENEVKPLKDGEKLKEGDKVKVGNKEGELLAIRQGNIGIRFENHRFRWCSQDELKVKK